MLKSSNINSVIDASGGEAQAYSLQVPSFESQSQPVVDTTNYNNNYEPNTSKQSCDEGVAMESTARPQSSTTPAASKAALQMSAGMLQIYEPPLLKARVQLKELIAKQNKIYIDLSGEKFKLENAEIAKLQSMMNNVKIYKEKLIKIKKQMQSIYQRTKSLKKRALNVQASKTKELQRKLHKQQQEEALIGRQRAQQNAATPNATDGNVAAENMHVTTAAEATTTSSY